MDRFNKIDKIYGDIKVLQYLGKLEYLCQCKCGENLVVKSYNLREDKKGIKKCPKCKDKEKKLRGEKEGKVFGNVEVLKFLGDKKYECFCRKCQKKFVTYTSNLREGKKGIKDCGCSGYTKDINFFKKIDTEQKAYILGFLASDGHVNSKNNNIKIVLNYQDFDILEKIAKEMQYNGPIRFKDVVTKLPSGKQCESKICELIICNKELVNDLLKIGLNDRKTYDFNFDFSLIPQNLQRHFLRGYFDGDGTCNITRGPSKKIQYGISCTGNTQILNSIKDILLQFFPDVKISLKSNRNYKNYTSILLIERKRDFKKIIQFFYRDSNIFLDRKYKRYKENMVIIDLIENKKERNLYNIPIEDKTKLYNIDKYKNFLENQ